MNDAERYRPVYELLDLPPVVYQVATGAVPFVDDDVVIPFNTPGHPPALIPIWADQEEIIGFWKHWFCDRQLSLVRVFFEFGARTVAWEEARTFEQLAIAVSLSALSGDWCPESEVRTFLEKCGISSIEYEQLIELWKVDGNDIRRYVDFERFRTAPPLSCFGSGCMESPGRPGYLGNFPFDGMRLDDRDLTDFCGVEAPEELFTQIASHPEAPPWFNAPGEYGQVEVFDALHAAGDLKGAWMSLNTEGWHAEDMRWAITRLANTANDDAFNTLVEAWTAVNDFDFTF